MDGVFVILIAILIEIIATWVLDWKPFDPIIRLKECTSKSGPILTFISWVLITFLALFFVYQGILLL